MEIVEQLSPERLNALERIVDTVSDGARLERVSPLSGGVSYQLQRIEYSTAGGIPGAIVLREADNLRADRWGLDLQSEFTLLEELQSSGLPVPITRYYDGSGEVLMHPFLVYDYIHGGPLLSLSDPASVGVMVAEQLIAIHNVRIRSEVAKLLPEWTDFVGSVIATDPDTFDNSIDERRVRVALETHWPLPTSDTNALLHGDLWPGNLLERHGRIVGVLDWENASSGDPLGDVAITRLDLLWSFGVPATIAFSRRYFELSEQDDSSLPIWDLFAALRPAGDLENWAATYPGLGRSDITLETMRAGHRWFVSQALAAL